MDGKEFATLPGFTYHVAFVRQTNGMDGASDETGVALTVAVQFTWNGWNIAVAHTGRDSEEPTGSQADDALFQISAGNEFDFGVTANMGWRNPPIGRPAT